MAWASLLHVIWDLPGSGIQPESPALSGRPFTTESPEEPQRFFLLKAVSEKKKPFASAVRVFSNLMIWGAFRISLLLLFNLPDITHAVEPQA